MSKYICKGCNETFKSENILYNTDELSEIYSKLSKIYAINRSVDLVKEVNDVYYETVLKFQVKSLMKDLKTLLVFGSKLISQEDRLFKASDYNMLLNIYNNYLKIFGLSNIDIFNDVLIDLKKKYEEFNTLKHV